MAEGLVCVAGTAGPSLACPRSRASPATAGHPVSSSCRAASRPRGGQGAGPAGEPVAAPGLEPKNADLLPPRRQAETRFTMSSDPGVAGLLDPARPVSPRGSRAARGLLHSQRAPARARHPCSEGSPPLAQRLSGNSGKQLVDLRTPGPKAPAAAAGAPGPPSARPAWPASATRAHRGSASSAPEAEFLDSTRQSLSFTATTAGVGCHGAP